MTGIGFILALSGFLLIALLIYEQRGDQKARLTTKTVLSCLFVIVALMQASSASAYSSYLIMGLIFCLMGDVFLALPGGKAFKAGLVAFLLGHLFYIASFSNLVSFSAWASPGSIPFWIISFLVFLWLRPHLGKMLFPVVLYILVITMMTSGAWAVFNQPSFPFSGRMFILLGAFLFYISDVFVARDKFVKPEYLNRLIGLPLYYLGQFLLSFSISFV
jgi:uncharacterized membrane protein YhhN